MRIGRLLQPLYEAIEARMLRTVIKPVEGPPLVKLEAALRHLALEASLYFIPRDSVTLHLRHFAVSPVSGESGSPRTSEGVRSIQRHDPRILFGTLNRHGQDTLRSLDELARIFMNAPPELAFLLAPASGDDTATDLSSLRNRVWSGFAGEYVRDYFWLVQNLEQFDVAATQWLFARLLQRIARGRQRTLRITPLVGLRLDGREVVLAPGTLLRPVTDFECHLWLNPDNMLSGNLPVRGLEVLRLLSVIEFEEPPESDEHPRSFFSQLNPRLGAPEAAAVAALRLLVEHVDHGEHIQPAFMERYKEGSTHDFRERCSPAGFRGSPIGGSYALTEEQRLQLPVLYERLLPLFDEKGASKLTPADRSLSVALNRYLLSAYRGEPKEWLLDCWVALEGLFTQRGEQQLTHKCATRISQELAALGLGPAQELYKKVRDSYDMRCEIIHGERALSDCFDIAWWTRRQLGRILQHRLLHASAAVASRPSGS